MDKKSGTDKAKIRTTLPVPLDEPMEKLESVAGTGELTYTINQLIKRQNALVKIVKTMLLKK